MLFSLYSIVDKKEQRLEMKRIEFPYALHFPSVKFPREKFMNEHILERDFSGVKRRIFKGAFKIQCK